MLNFARGSLLVRRDFSFSLIESFSSSRPGTKWMLVQAMGHAVAKICGAGSSMSRFVIKSSCLVVSEFPEQKRLVL